MNEGERERNGKESNYGADAQKKKEKRIKVIWRESGRKDNVSYKIYQIPVSKSFNYGGIT